jgi:hypothetical protein
MLVRRQMGQTGQTASVDDDYLWLLKRVLTNMIYGDDHLSHLGMGIRPFDSETRRVGGDWPLAAHTMVGLERLSQLQYCVETVLDDGVPGDFIETGVWRGGASILVRAILKHRGVADRTVWLADSFAGLPPPDVARYPADAGLDLSRVAHLKVSQADVRENFLRYGLLDDQVQFLEGWFRDTLVSAPIEHLAVLRLDGDLYESTIVALEALYPRLSVGGFVIVDDLALPTCRQAVDDFRAAAGITDELVMVDWTGGHWRKSVA